jgi:hypothetical protein
MSIQITEIDILKQFKDADLPIPANIHYYSLDIQQSIIDYLKQLDEKDIKTYKIATNHLGTSFNLFKSNGYLNWLKKK